MRLVRYFLFAFLCLASVRPATAAPAYLERLKNPDFLADTLGEGTTLAQTQELRLGLGREISYCDGAPVGFFKYYVSRHCCTLTINQFTGVRSDQDLILQAAVRTIDHVTSYYDELTSTSGFRPTLMFTCSAGVVTKQEFTAAFGELFQVLEAKPLSQDFFVKKIRYERATSPAEPETREL